MNYDNALAHYVITNINPVSTNTTNFYLMADGTIEEVGGRWNATPSQVISDANGYAKNNNKDIYGVIHREPLGGNVYALFTTEIDWVSVKNFSSEELNVYGDVLTQTYYTQEADYLAVGLSYSQVYYDYTPLSLPTYLDGYEAVLPQGYFCLYDFNMVSTLQVITQDTESFYDHLLEFGGAYDENYTMDIYVGSNIASAKASAYNDGYESGYGNGRGVGYNDGYRQGFEDGQSTNLPVDTKTAFDFIGGAFGAVGSILEIEVLPNINLGLCFSIPLVLVLIMTIFKLVKK